MLMSKQELDEFTSKLIQTYNAMKAKGHWMESGTIELDDGTQFSYKIKQLTKKNNKRKRMYIILF